MALTASQNLRLDKVLDFTLHQLKRRLAPVLRFSHKFQAQGVQRGKTLHVPFVPLSQLASQDWDPAVGYGNGNFNIEEKEVPIDKRKFQVISFTSEELVQMPIDIVNEAMAQSADKLAADIVADILSHVTAENFGAAILTEEPSAFDTDMLADLKTACSDIDWPDVGRTCVVNSLLANPLMKDPAIKNASASGSTQTLREGTFGNIFGFDLVEATGLPDNGERLAGIAALQYGLLLANAPILPTEEVLHALSEYRTVTDPATGLTLTYRSWGNPDMDSAKKIIEVTYGVGIGDPAQLKRICTPAPQAPEE